MEKQTTPKPPAADHGKQAADHGKQPAMDHGKKDEARHLAEEAVKELQHGNKDEAAFVLNEARALDKDAVEQVLKDNKAKP